MLCATEESVHEYGAACVSGEAEREIFFSELITFNILYKGKGEVGTAVDKPYP